jgi:hypothetical protein
MSEYNDHNVSLTHYHPKRLKPFLTLSDLPEDKAIELMSSLYEDSEYGRRFKDPREYITNRKKTEVFVRNRFIQKGRKPTDDYPLYMIVQDSEWLQKNGPLNDEGKKIVLPLFIFSVDDVSFTIPDSMVSFWLFHEQKNPLYKKEIHGIAFDKIEIIEYLNTHGLPEFSKDKLHPPELPQYIEVQVWNRKIIYDYLGITP